MSELSPQAQAVLDAYRSSHLSINNLAAALRAVADQVVPKEIEPANAFEEEGFVPFRLREQRQETRTQFLAIADELESK